MASTRALRGVIIAIAAVVVGLASSAQSQAVAFQPATPPPRADGSCVIPREQPVANRVRAGDRVWVTCINGEILVLVDRSHQREARTTAGRKKRSAEEATQSAYRRVVASEPSAGGLAATAAWPIDPDLAECDANADVASHSARDRLQGTPEPASPTIGSSGAIVLGPVRPASPSLVAAVILALRAAVACADSDMTQISVTEVQDLGAGRVTATVIRSTGGVELDRMLVDFIQIENQLALAGEIGLLTIGTPIP